MILRLGNFTISFFFFFLNDTATPEIYTLPLPDALPISGAAPQIAVTAGNNQTVTAGTAVQIAPSVIVKDASGNPVPGVAVTFAVTPGNGSITGASQMTDAGGIATVGSWTLEMTAGKNTLTATVGGLTGSPGSFTATGTAGNAGSHAGSGG